MSPRLPTRLPPRLEAVSRMVPEGSRVAEIGSDHGHLAFHLLLSGRASWCVATDVIPLEGVPSAPGLDLRIGDGLAPLRPEDGLDVLVLGGLGCRTIIHILSDPKRGDLGASRLVMQPQSEAPLLRRWLNSQRLALVDEVLVQDAGRFYVILAAEPGDPWAAYRHPDLSRDDLLAAGPLLLRSGDAAVVAFWTQRLARQEALLTRGARGRAGDLARREAARARRVLGVVGGTERR